MVLIRGAPDECFDPSTSIRPKVLAYPSCSWRCWRLAGLTKSNLVQDDATRLGCAWKDRCGPPWPTSQIAVRRVKRGEHLIRLVIRVDVRRYNTTVILDSVGLPVGQVTLKGLGYSRVNGDLVVRERGEGHMGNTHPRDSGVTCPIRPLARRALLSEP